MENAQRAMGFMDLNETYLIHADFGTTYLRFINLETLEEYTIDTGIMSNYIKILYDYLLIVDMNNIYLFELNKNQIIATF